MTLLALILAIIQVESSNNDYAYNKISGATGCMQIKEILIRDVNQRHGTHYTLDDRFDRAKSIEIFHLTMQHYVTEKRLGRVPTFRDYAGVWKQGFKSYTDDPTLSNAYWAKVRAALYENNIRYY